MFSGIPCHAQNVFEAAGVDPTPLDGFSGIEKSIKLKI